MRRVALTILAVICIALGAITLPLPLPTGAILLTIGLALLLLASKRVRGSFLRYRRRTPWFNERLSSVEPYLPDRLRRVLSGRRRGV